MLLGLAVCMCVSASRHTYTYSMYNSTGAREQREKYGKGSRKGGLCRVSNYVNLQMLFLSDPAVS